jgi:hypothetical protein
VSWLNERGAQEHGQIVSRVHSHHSGEARDDEEDAPDV